MSRDHAQGSAFTTTTWAEQAAVAARFDAQIDAVDCVFAVIGLSGIDQLYVSTHEISNC